MNSPDCGTQGSALEGRPKCGADTGVAPPAPGSAALFPRNPERDANGNAVLYPGFARFEGVAALYSTERGEVILLAPTVEALQAHVRHFALGNGELDRTKCIITHGERLPNDEVRHAATQPKD